MKKINKLVFGNVTISDLSTIKGGRKQPGVFDTCSLSKLDFHNDSITWWPSKFLIKYKLHELGKFNIESIK
jgi:hypothetical protein